jgi:hypothetical protein
MLDFVLTILEGLRVFLQSETIPVVEESEVPLSLGFEEIITLFVRGKSDKKEELLNSGDGVELLNKLEEVRVLADEGKALIVLDEEELEEFVPTTLWRLRCSFQLVTVPVVEESVELREGPIVLDEEELLEFLPTTLWRLRCSFQLVTVPVVEESVELREGPIVLDEEELLEFVPTTLERLGSFLCQSGTPFVESNTKISTPALGFTGVLTI